MNCKVLLVLPSSESLQVSQLSRILKLKKQNVVMMREIFNASMYPSIDVILFNTNTMSKFIKQENPTEFYKLHSLFHRWGERRLLLNSECVKWMYCK